MPRIEAMFDGACEPRNPGGHAAWGAVVKLDGVVVYAEGGYCGHGPKMSNNVAEYSGFCAALREALKYEGPIHIRGDSRLVICQLNAAAARKLGYRGLWKSKGGLYKPFQDEAKALLAGNEHRITMSWVPREQNDECDYLSKDVLRQRGITFRIQPEKELEAAPF